MNKIILHLSILINVATCRDFTLGMLKKNDLLMSQDTVFKDRIPHKLTYSKYGRTFNCPITYVRVLDQLNIGRGPRVQVIRGGLGKNNIVLRLTSPYNKPLSVIIFVGCENKKFRKLTWKNIRHKNHNITSLQNITTAMVDVTKEKHYLQHKYFNRQHDNSAGKDANETSNFSVVTSIVIGEIKTDRTPFSGKKRPFQKVFLSGQSLKSKQAHGNQNLITNASGNVFNKNIISSHRKVTITKNKVLVKKDITSGIFGKYVSTVKRTDVNENAMPGKSVHAIKITPIANKVKSNKNKANSEDNTHTKNEYGSTVSIKNKTITKTVDSFKTPKAIISTQNLPSEKVVTIKNAIKGVSTQNKLTIKSVFTTKDVNNAENIAITTNKLFAHEVSSTLKDPFVTSKTPDIKVIPAETKASVLSIHAANNVSTTDKVISSKDESGTTSSQTKPHKETVTPTKRASSLESELPVNNVNSVGSPLSDISSTISEASHYNMHTAASYPTLAPLGGAVSKANRKRPSRHKTYKNKHSQFDS